MSLLVALPWWKRKPWYPYTEVPITLTSDLGTPMTENPVDVDLVNGTLRLYFLPDPHKATLYAFEPLRSQSV